MAHTMNTRRFFTRASLVLTALACGQAWSQSDYMPFPRSAWPAGIQTSWEIQGEYFGVTSEGARLGAWLVARNQSSTGTTPNRYGVAFLPGGLLTLPGDTLYGGWDQVTKWQGSGTGSSGILIVTLADGKNFILGTSGSSPATTSTGGVTLDSVTGTGEARFLHGHTATATFKLARVVRKSPTANMKPKPEWSAASWFDTATASADLAKWQTQDNAPTLYQSVYLYRGSKTINSLAHGRGYLHIEFMTCFNPYQTGQNRGNSGIYLQGKYETQVLDSYGLAGLNDEFGGIYTVRAADVNAALPPNTWHTYDIYFTPRTSGTAGQTAGAAYLTVYANGVKTQDSIPAPSVTTAGLTGDMLVNAPLYLQNHSNAVIYRNIWWVANATTQSLPWSSVLSNAGVTAIKAGAPRARAAMKPPVSALSLDGGVRDLNGRRLSAEGQAHMPTVSQPGR
jgi:hypothetical protein